VTNKLTPEHLQRRAIIYVRQSTVIQVAQNRESQLRHPPGSLATLIYRLLRWGQHYVDEGAEAYERRYQQFRITALKARELGYQLVQNA
jgi:hypothetical protein